VLADCAAMLPRSYTAWAETPGVDVLLLVTMILWVSLVALPQLIIWLWQCRPLPEGELRQRLTVLLQRSGVRAREIRVWGPRGSGLLNACVVGGWARHRYVLISPALVDELGMEETEAVLAHELGHARYGHLTFLLMMIVCLSLLLSFVTEFLPASVRASPAAEIGVMISFVGAYMYWFYGAMMRQCEREADLASAELIGTPAPLVRALERLGQIGGNVRAVWCWHHGSIAQRVAAVERLSQDAAASAEFHTQQARIRRWFLVLTVVAVAAEVYVRIRV
jgi:Zn-dependent protease with chaperone function